MSQGLAFLIWLLCVGISAVLIGYFFKYNVSLSKSEGFAITVTTCPSNTNQYITSDGKTNCCNGNIVGGNCTGNPVCTLSPRSSSQDIPTCTEKINLEAIEKGINKCPSLIPNYFKASDNSREGCSVSPQNSSGTAPSDENALKCILYATVELNKLKLDSCYNYLENVRLTKISQLPGCITAALEDANSQGPSSSDSSSCPQPVASDFVIKGDWISTQTGIPVQKRMILPNKNILYASQDGTNVKIVVTDKNNIQLYAKYYSGNISDIDKYTPRLSDLNDASGHYILSTK
jgi:hypothetical protein